MANQTISNDTVIIHAVGDVTPRRVDYGEAPESLFENVHRKVKEADIAFCQLEASLSTRGCLQWRDHTTWYGRAHPDNVKSFVHGGFNVVSNASNHCFDYGPEAIADTIDVLQRNNIQVIGIGKDIAEARKPAILERKGVRVGFLAYCSALPVEFEARDGKAGCAAVRVTSYYENQDFAPGMPPRIITVPLEADARAMEEDIRKLRKEADIVVVSMHWGLHFIPGELATYQPALGHRAIDAGADLIIGHHPHLIKGIEKYKRGIIFYSVGNFAQETPHHLKPPPGVIGERVSIRYRRWKRDPAWEPYGGPPDKKYSIMVRCAVRNKALQEVSFLPCWINRRSEPEFLPRSDPRFQEVLDYIQPWCEELGTSLEVKGDEVIVPILSPPLKKGD
ncbi:MAG: CapA family protein [Chloroflexi bacterium]|nr:CapA family protein [Chloroflexota bacterium]